MLSIIFPWSCINDFPSIWIYSYLIWFSVKRLFFHWKKLTTERLNNRNPSFSRNGNVRGYPAHSVIWHCHCDCRWHPLVLIIQMNIIHAQWFYYVHAFTGRQCKTMWYNAYIWEYWNLNSKHSSVLCNVQKIKTFSILIPSISRQ